MTITAARILESKPVFDRPSGRNSPNKPPAHLWTASEPPFRGYQKPPAEAYAQTSPSTAIVIDNGSSLLRAGWSFQHTPCLSFPSQYSKFRDRKLARTCTYVGWDTYADATTRGQIKHAFEPGTSIVGNWDVMENVLDYTLLRMGVENHDGGIGRPVVMTEPVANLNYSRKMMSEILFEAYHAPAVAYGIDALFSYRQNQGKTGLVVSSAHSSTHLIPVIDSRPVLSSVSRLNWGGYHGADYLLKLLKLKYPTFPGKMTETQIADFVREHCYLSLEYENELRSFLDWSGLEDRDHVIQYPFTEHVVTEKTEEELARIAERKAESGRRLQEQAAKMRLDRLVRKEQELEYYKDLQGRLDGQTKKEVKRLLDEDEFRDEAALDRRIKELEKSIRKARNKDVGGPEKEEEEEAPTFPLLEIPDEELDEAGLKQKRHQRLMKSGLEARQRAREEKEAEKARLAEEQRLDDEKRDNDLPAWLEEKRQARESLLVRIKDRERQKADLGNRKSLASQMRMKTLAHLAADQPGRKRRRGGDDDNFGANDDDWGVYRTVQTNGDGPGASDDEEDGDAEDDLGTGLQSLEALLLQHDPDFNERDTYAAQTDWTTSLLHAFLRGPRPFDAESTREIHQIHLNVERIRVPEVVFQPAIAGLDQAGIVEIASDILTQRLAGLTIESSPSSSQPSTNGASSRAVTAAADAALRDIFLTGGNTLFENFDERLRRGLRQLVPTDAVLHVRRARDPLLDAWKGAASWARDQESHGWPDAVSRAEFLEKGPDYLKEHGYGNVVGAL